MKYIFTLLCLVTFGSIYSCNRQLPTDDETTIERQEDIRRDDIIEKRNMETPTHDKDLELDQDVIEVKDFELDE